MTGFEYSIGIFLGLIALAGLYRPFIKTFRYQYKPERGKYEKPQNSF